MTTYKLTIDGRGFILTSGLNPYTILRRVREYDFFFQKPLGTNFRITFIENAKFTNNDDCVHVKKIIEAVKIAKQEG